MNSRHYFAHLVLNYKPKHSKDSDQKLGEVVKEHFKKSLSVEAVTANLRERLVKRRKREAAYEELARLERELLVMSEMHDERIEFLKKKVQELKKKVNLTGPLP